MLDLLASLYRDGRADHFTGVACASGGAAAAGVGKGCSDDWIRVCYITGCRIHGRHILIKVSGVFLVMLV